MIKAKLNLAYRYDNHLKLDKETDPELDESLFGDWTNDPHTLVANFQYQTELRTRADELALHTRIAWGFLIGLQSLKKPVDEEERLAKAEVAQSQDKGVGQVTGESDDSGSSMETLAREEGGRNTI